MLNYLSSKYLLSVFIIASVILCAYWNVWQIFPQQDEWLGLGGAKYRQETMGFSGYMSQIFSFQSKDAGVRFLPITFILNYIIYNNISLNFPLYGVLSLVIALISSVILNLIVYKLTHSQLISVITASVWITNNIQYQAFSWIGTMVPSLLSMLFFLLGLYFLILFNEKRKTHNFVISIICVTISLFTKETTIFYLVPYLGIIWLYFNKNFKFLSKLKLSFLLLIPLLIGVFLPRLIYMLNSNPGFYPAINPASRIDLVYNIFLLPAKSLFHIFLSNTRVFEYVYSANRVFYETQTDGFVLARLVGDAFSLLIAFYILLFIGLTLGFADKPHKKLILFSLLSFFASFLPFIIFKNTDVIIEPRYYILPAIFASILLVTAVHSLTSKMKYLGSFLTVLIFVPILLFNIDGIKKMLSIDIGVGNYRRGMLNTVSEIKPRLSKNSVFYFFTGHTGFYEFQSGFGQTMAVWLYDSSKIPKEALIDKDFWESSYEGIKSFERGKYGYFMTYDKLLNALKENPDIALDQVHAYYWDYQKHTVKNVSEEIREKLKVDTSNEKIPQ